MACVNRRRIPFIWHQREQITVLVVNIFSLILNAQAQLDIPGSSSPRPNEYFNQYNGISTVRPYNPQIDQYNNPYSSTPRQGVYSSTPRYQQDYVRGLNPDVTNRGHSNQNVPDYNNRVDNRNYNQNPQFPDADQEDYYRNQNGFRDPQQGNQQDNQQFNQHRDTLALRKLLSQIDVQASGECANNVAAQWNFETDVNEVSQLAAVSQFYSLLIFRAVGSCAHTGKFNCYISGKLTLTCLSYSFCCRMIAPT